MPICILYSLDGSSASVGPCRASREVHEVHKFFQHANFIINVVSASTKSNDELLATQAEEIAREIELGELDTGRGANQMSSL